MKTYRFTSLKTGVENIGTLKVYWEVNYDSISDDYTPDEISAKKLFEKWTSLVREKYPNGLIPIMWFVRVMGNHGSGFEFMPFQYELQKLKSKPKNYLDYWSHPIDCETEKFLDWLSLPVGDKFWNSKHDHKGGFIQQFTGWKPSILQPYVYLPALTSKFIS